MWRVTRLAARELGLICFCFVGCSGFCCVRLLFVEGEVCVTEESGYLTISSGYRACWAKMDAGSVVGGSWAIWRRMRER